LMTLRQLSLFLLVALAMFAGDVSAQAPARSNTVPQESNDSSNMAPEEETDIEVVEEYVPSRQYAVVLDPGHGGHDLGVRSSKSQLEKSIAMKLASAIRSKIRNKYANVTVHLTREGDLERSLLRRLEFANSKKADLFLSIHTSGGFSPQSLPVDIFIPGNSTRASAEEWVALNRPYKNKNKLFAKSLSRHLQSVVKGRDIEIVASDRLMLEGLAMPAAMIEPLDLSNPQDEMLIENDSYINQIASAIAKGIIDYLGVRDPAPEPEESNE